MKKMRYTVEGGSRVIVATLFLLTGALVGAFAFAGHQSAAPRETSEVISVHLSRAFKVECAEPPVPLRDATVQFCGDAAHRAVVVVKEDGSWFVREIVPDGVVAPTEAKGGK